MPDRNRLKQICGISIVILALLAFILVLMPGQTQMPPTQLASSSEPEPGPSAEPTPAPTPTPNPTPTPTSAPDVPAVNPPTDNLDPADEPVYSGPELEEGERMGDEFFDNSLFVGNSLVHGLWGFGGISSADYAAATSASVVNLDRVRNEALWGVEEEDAPSVLESIHMGSYDKVYLLLGINEIGFETPDFIAIYSTVLDTIAAAQPEADIYIMGLTPLTAEKDAAGWPFTMERVLSYNEALKTLAGEREYYYVDLVEALADESGFMPAADSTDGVHLIREKYPKWAEYLRTHYAEETE
ncbi:MAG: hypothetical protein IJY96_07485 [Oscillospiraceae bacterium]|nr:hypothetical protein [Oscillospiraceae bacterium]